VQLHQSTAWGFTHNGGFIRKREATCFEDSNASRYIMRRNQPNQPRYLFNWIPHWLLLRGPPLVTTIFQSERRSTQAQLIHRAGGGHAFSKRGGRSPHLVLQHLVTAVIDDSGDENSCRRRWPHRGHFTRRSNPWLVRPRRSLNVRPWRRSRGRVW